MTDKIKSSLELAQEHWNWLREVLDKQREMERKLFIDAFVHGFGHGLERFTEVKVKANLKRLEG